MRAFLAALEALSFVERFIEFVPPLLAQGNHDSSAIIQPFPTFHCELLALYRVFNCFVRHLVLALEDRERDQRFRQLFCFCSPFRWFPCGNWFLSRQGPWCW